MTLKWSFCYGYTESDKRRIQNEKAFTAMQVHEQNHIDEFKYLGWRDFNENLAANATSE